MYFFFSGAGEDESFQRENNLCSVLHSYVAIFLVLIDDLYAFWEMFSGLLMFNICVYNEKTPQGFKASCFILPVFIQWRDSIHPDSHPAYLPLVYVGFSISCAVRATKLVYRSENILLVISLEGGIPGICFSLDKWGLHVRSIFVL